MHRFVRYTCDRCGATKETGYESSAPPRWMGIVRNYTNPVADAEAWPRPQIWCGECRDSFDEFARTFGDPE